jgi:DNA-binding response OmpR family regulator
VADPYRILIVEDDPDLLEVLQREFRHNGFEVFGARDGVAGMEITLQNHPDVILLDLLLPQLEGLSMYEKIQRYDWGKEVPVIVLTNYDDPVFTHKAAKLGVVDYIIKSDHKPSEIAHRVKEYLDHSTAGTANQGPQTQKTAKK